MIVGVTGGVGSGKTCLTNVLENLGARVIDVDKIAKKLVDDVIDIQKELRKTFGPAIFDSSGELKRRELGRICFSDSEKLNCLNEIFSPYLMKTVTDEVKQIIEEEEEEEGIIIVVDMAILYELGLETLFDMIVVVKAPFEKRLKWLSDDRCWSREETMQRIEVQMDVKEKLRRADVVIDNSGSLEDLRQKARDFYQGLLDAE